MRFLDDDSVYHVVSRVAFRRFLFDDDVKRKFVDLMRRQAAFCGAEVLAFCVMSNHFHLLLSFAENPIPSNDEALVKRYRKLYPKQEWLSEKTLSPERLEHLLKEGGDHAVRIRKQLHARMGKLSVFMKELKQRISIWYNRNHDNVGAIWESNYRSQLVEKERSVIRKVAAYIEMNPVRAGVVEQPEDYAWSSLGMTKARPSFLRDVCFKLWFGDASLTEATLSECSEFTEQDRRMLRGGCIGTAEFVGRICQKFIPERSGRHRPVLWEQRAYAAYILRQVGQ